MEDKIKAFRAMVEESKHIVFFGGAGVSTESGIPDFRSVDGLYHQQYRYPPETIISHSFWEQNPAEFYEFYRSRMMFLDARPNGAHKKLAQWEAEGKLSAVITQNIDGLHQLAGSRTVLELHGSIHRNYCQKCGAFYDAAFIKNSSGIPRCSCGGIVKPDVVLYEESLDDSVLQESVDAISNADMLIIGGTSLVVYPAAGLVNYYRGDRLCVLNKDPAPAQGRACLFIQGKLGEVLSAC